jgi:predicted nucleotidyltransferase
VNSTATYNKICKTVSACLPGARVVLFGSHARGEQDRHSDYDLLIITPVTYSPIEKIQWSTRLDNALIEAINAPVDLLLNSEEEIREKQELPGHIVRSAIREGIIL